MSYFISKTIFSDFDQAIAKVTQELKNEEFGVLSDIDIQEKFRERLNISDFRKYRILGACHPPSAYRAIQMDDKVGTMLPCNVIVQEMEPGKVNIAAIDPAAAMSVIGNPELEDLARQITGRLKKVIAAL